ncbi:DUF4912 domain-containing protein [Polyangium aurulentum]|uniref:DUF4912 domain-containing protein n=1 Tax=Polyangium aurulentum TaxID=2567896 RepID=UPI0010AE5952|nr:DUF4912 domain-containing protein [Polyangium aurulentum]UQA59632.1 DUF4912 domain-containing protein [Polyangium aurulentum]
MERHELEGLTREELIALAERLGISRPRVLTVPELVDEIVSRTAASERDRVRSRGWLGRARDLLAGVIERGMHLPEVARSVRGPTGPWPKAPPPLATVTLAEIYAAQGHLEKALGVLDDVITREPEHAEARALRQRLAAQLEGRASGHAPGSEPAPDSGDEASQAEEVAAGEMPSAASAEAEAEAVAVEKPLVPEAAAAPVAVPVPVTSADAPVEPAPVVPAAGAEAETIEPLAEPSVEEEIEDLPLPERYNVDEIVAVSVDPTTVYLYWEVRPTSMARARAHRPEGALVVRMISVTPSWQGPLVDQRDLRVDALYGDVYVRNLRPGSNVRVTVGWLASGELDPFAIGAEVATPRASLAPDVAHEVARWTPEPPAAPAHVHAEAPAHAAAPASAEPSSRWAEDTAVEWPIDAGAMQPHVTEAALPEVARPPAPQWRPPPAQRTSSSTPSWPVFEVGQGEPPRPWVPGQHGPMRWGGGEGEWSREGDVTKWTREGSVTEWTREGGVTEWSIEGGVTEWSIEGGVTGWSRGGASEWMRGGASERLRGGASERLRGGASERLRGGASERLRGGASEQLRGGASEQLRGGASERVRRGR